MSNDDHIGLLAHHATVIVGGDSVREALLERLERQERISLQGNPDLFDRRYAAFSIDDAREIKSAHETRPMSEEAKKVFVLTMDGITVEAQNALLKLLEEPAPYAYFFIIISSSSLLLPTVLSRAAVLSLGGAASAPLASEAQADIAADAAAFLKLAPAKRLDFVKKFVEEISKEKRPKHDAVELLGALERLIRGKGQASLVKSADALKAISLARGYATDRAPSLKMLLEYVALSV